MRTLFMTLTLISALTNMNAQNWNGSVNTINGKIYRQGKVGIGITTDPVQNLELNGNFSLLSGTERLLFSSVPNSHAFLVPLNQSNGDWDWGKQLGYSIINESWFFKDKLGIGSAQNPSEILEVTGNAYIKNNIFWGVHKNSGLTQDQGGSIKLGGINQTSTPYIDFYNDANEQYKARFILSDSNTLTLNRANFGIGTINATEKLTVNGKILCEEVEVILDVPADYVFQKYYMGESNLKADYTMPTLEEVEAFTKANHHLPEVPSAAELKEDGLQLKEMTNLLLQKVEELTLYTIEQEKRIKSLEAKLVEQK